MSAPAASSSTAAQEAATRVQAQLDEHAVALATLRDAHAAVQIALHLHTLQRGRTKCVALSDQEVAADAKALPSIPPGWSSSADGFCFQYATSAGGSSAPCRLVIKSIRMDRTLLVHGAVKAPAGGADASASASQQQPSIRSVDIPVDEHINSNALAGGAGAGADGAPDFAKLFKDLPALLRLYDSALIDPLLPKPTPAAEAQKAPPAAAEAQPIDPLRVPPRRRPGEEDDNPYLRDPFMRPRGGDFAGDLDPLAVGGPNSGNLMGPRNFPGMGGAGRGGPPHGPPGMAPRFDPYGPMPGMGDPDFDELLPPGPGGPNMGGLGGPGFGPGFGPRRGGSAGGLGGPRGGGGFRGLDPRGGGPGGFPGGGFM